MRILHSLWRAQCHATRDSYSKEESSKIDQGQVAEAFPKTEASFLNFPSRKLSFIGLGSPLKTVIYFFIFSLSMLVVNQDVHAQLTDCDIAIVPDDRDMQNRVQLNLDDMCTACGIYGGDNGSPGMPPNGAAGCAVIQIRADFMPDCMTIVVDPQSTERTSYYYDFNLMESECFMPDGVTENQGETFTFWKQDLTLDNGFYHLLVCSQSTGNRFFRIVDGCCPDPGMDAEVFACEGSEDVIDLFAALGGADMGGTWARESGSGGTFDDMAGTFIPGADGTTSTFSYTVPRDPNLPFCDLESIVTVTVGGPDPGEDGETTVCLESEDPVDLFSLLSGADMGGTWMRESGMGGTFDDMAGTYIPGMDGTTSSFSYTVDPNPNFPDCNDLTSLVTVNVEGANAGMGRDTTVCYNIMDPDPVVVDLSTLLTDSDPGGTWARESGMGGTFDMMAGTYAPAPDGTTSTFSYTVGNPMIQDCSFSTTVTVIIDDVLQPDIVCDDLVLALSYNDPEIIDADTLIESMSDECGHIISVQGRRMEDPFACGYPDNAILSDSIAFCCADVGQTIMVELHVTDDSGNTAICMAEVMVVDEVAPQIWSCVDDVTISCQYDLDLDDLSEFGTLEINQQDVDYLDIDDEYFQNTQAGDAKEGMFQENCPGWTVRTVVTDERDCNQGVILRKFYVTDAQGKSDSCVQTITVIDVDPFIWDDIMWPEDVDYEDCTLLLPNPGPGPDPDETGRPTFKINDICSQPTATYNDLIFDDPTSGCIKVQRTWKVIDWCTYDKVTKEGSWTWEQYIKIINTTAPVWEVVPDTLDLCVAGVGCASDQSFEISATDDCTTEEDLTYLFEVDLNNDGDVDTSGEANEITIYMEQGTHKITWTVEDRCGNDTTRMQIVNVKECKAPTPICLWGLAASLNQEGETVIWATDFNNKSNDNCTDEENLIFSFSSDTDSTSMVITCDDIGELAVQMWVTDEAGNQSYCETYIDVQDSHDVCPGGGNNVDEEEITQAMIAGHIGTENNIPVREVQVNISGPELDTYQMTDGEGDYAFEGLDAHYNYEVIPVKDDDPLVGVSTLDIVLVQQHILGIKELESPYKLIAADINNSESVSSIDLIQLRKMILGIHDAFPENNSWRFVESQYGILEETSPWPFVEGMYVEDLSEDMMGNDFVAVKIGDVNGSVEEKLHRQQVETRSSEQWVLGAGDRDVKAGEVVEMTLTGHGLRQMIALQWTITVDSDRLSVVGWEGNKMSVSEAHFGLIDGEGQHLTFAWTDLESKTYNEGSELMTITLQAIKGGRLSDMVAFGSTITPAVGYNASQDKVDLQWQWQEDISGEVVLHQNAPNPFIDRTSISFELPRDMNATLELYDVSGKLMYQKNDFYNQGKNTIFVNSSEIEGMPGVVYYVLKTEGNSITKKMILLR
ncbi:MAG: T9SS type A sorting domain-containing protein [Saprospiraceae bacterium]|nr:T9SS type A sorting domain-containing protein [Saprospiraceae bacterium]